MLTNFHHKFPFLVIGGIALVSAYLVLFSNNTTQNPQTTPSKETTATPQESTRTTPYFAAFLIFTNGTRRVFTSPQYHNLSEMVYISNPNPSVITVADSESTWGDFFSTLPMGLSDTCLTTGTGQVFCDGQGGELRFFLNNQESSEILSKKINPLDKLLITYGNSSESAILQQFAQIPDPNNASDSGTLGP
jgi:hypothetical protein